MMKTAKTIIFLFLSYICFTSHSSPGNANHVKAIHEDTGLLQKQEPSNKNPWLKIRNFELEVITPSSGIQLYNDGIVYLSLTKSHNRMVSKHISFGDRELYYATINDSVPANPLPLIFNRDLTIPADGICFTDDNTVLYYSALSKVDNRIKIYRAQAAGGEKLFWETDDKPLSFCHDYSNYTHPAVSSAGDLMIFSSDMPGGSGGMDLYVSRYENNTWTRPENMGIRFNSKGSELYAFLDNENNLYFSSDGLPGLGGYDIFFSSYNGSGWESPINLNDQVNTGADEVAFLIGREGENFGFFTRIEKTGLAKKQLSRKLYKLEPSEEPVREEKGMLAGILEDYARGSALLALRNEDIEPEVKTEEKKPDAEIAAEEKRIADSLLAAQEEANRLAEERRVADSLLAARMEAQRLAEEKRISDSLRMEEIRKREAEAARERVVYRVQILASTSKGGTYNVRVSGTRQDTWEYFYQGAWRITVGEFTDLDDAVAFRKDCREAGYNQAFVVAFKNGVRSLDPELFRR